jgi:hypothetical protein
MGCMGRIKEHQRQYRVGRDSRKRFDMFLFYKSDIQFLEQTVCIYCQDTHCTEYLASIPPARLAYQLPACIALGCCTKVGSAVLAGLPGMQQL